MIFHRFTKALAARASEASAVLGGMVARHGASIRLVLRQIG
jgi:hypothetical protein